MLTRLLIVIFFSLLLYSCSNKKDEAIYLPTDQSNPYTLYKEGLDAFEKNDYFFAEKKFSEAELNFEEVDLLCKVSYNVKFFSLCN